ncbi:MAG: hypothetical protein GY771_09115 [bacterium]|nr:hypothetical protein [bacterium]
MRREIPLIICFALGLIMVVQFFVPHQWSLELYQNALQWLVIVLTFATLLGIGSLIRLHIGKIRFKRRDWLFSVVALFGLALSIGTGFLGIIGVYAYGQGYVPVEGSSFAAIYNNAWFQTFIGRGIDQGSAFMWLYNYIQIPMQATMFSLLAFFIASASFRTFRARTLEASLLLIAAIIVMLGRVSFDSIAVGIIESIFGSADTSSFVQILVYPFVKLSTFAEWILDYPNMAAKRGILIGVGLGVMSMALKIILGIERTWLGGE